MRYSMINRGTGQGCSGPDSSSVAVQLEILIDPVSHRGNEIR